MHSKTNCDGIALSSDLKYLYWTSLATYRTFRAPTENLLTITSNTDENNIIEFIGMRGSQTGGMIMSDKNILYYGSFNNNAINYISNINETSNKITYNTSDYYQNNNNLFNSQLLNESILVKNDTTLQWPDSFGWDSNGNYLWITTNKLHRFILGNMVWNGSQGSNMRVIKVYVENQSSYQMRCIIRQDNCSYDDDDDFNINTTYINSNYNNSNNTKHETSKKNKSLPVLWEVVLGVAVLLVIVLASMFCIWQRRPRNQDSGGLLLADNDQDFIAM